jgi:hypothetical protein
LGLAAGHFLRKVLSRRMQDRSAGIAMARVCEQLVRTVSFGQAGN